MSISPLPTPLQEPGGRRFAFYPPIRNIEHNEWIHRRTTWSEFIVVNARSGEEACIPRGLLDDVSFSDFPEIVVSLKRALEWKDGAVSPHHQPVIEFPLSATDERPSVPHPERPAPVVNIRLESPGESRRSKKIAVSILLGAVACLLGADIARQIEVRQRTEALRQSLSSFHLQLGDRYATVAGKLGPPSAERVFSLRDGHVRRVLSYPRLQILVVLTGRTMESAGYSGALDTRGRALEGTGWLRWVPRF